MHPGNSHMTEQLLSIHLLALYAPSLGNGALTERELCEAKSDELRVNKSYDAEKRIQWVKA